MFKKPFKVKSNTQIKSSELKNLKAVFLSSFPILSPNDLDVLIPKKQTVFCMRIICSDERALKIFFIQKRAIAFEVDGILFPTIYFLWNFPQVALTFTTTSYVISKIRSGADLMLPGVIANPSLHTDFPANTITCINTVENKAPLAVGVTSMSSQDMRTSHGRGKCIVVYHFYGDKLCLAEDMPLLPVPELGAPEAVFESNNVMDDNKGTEEEFIPEDVEETTDNSEEIIEEESKECLENSMDSVMLYCFLAALKYSKSLEIPILTSSFYKLEMIPACPPDKNLDVKKTSYKKLGQFLKTMMKDGIVEVKEKKKGAEYIVSVNNQHPSFVNFYLPPESRPKKLTETNNQVNALSIIEEYVVTPVVLPLFANSGLSKGDMVQASEVRKHVTNYIKVHDCQDKIDQKFVKMQDPHLANICKNSDRVTWEELMEKILKSMKSCYKVTTKEEEKISKGKIEPIKITVETRTGNKKVTLIDNLELYGIRMSEFAKECQHRVAASTTVNKLSGKKSDQLLVQGNQVNFVYNLLLDKYKIPKKYLGDAPLKTNKRK